MFGSTATSGITSAVLAALAPSRVALPVTSGSYTPTNGNGVNSVRGSIFAARIGWPPGFHVVPLSVERLRDRLKSNCAPWSLLRKFRISLNTSTSVPSGSTTIWLPIVWLMAPGS